MFFEYGDDSVAQLGGVHLACEQASNLLTKVLEWGRLMAYLEQSTRYIAYDTRIGGRYRYYRDPEVLGSPLGTRYVGDMDRLFDTYAELRAAAAGLLPASSSRRTPATPTSCTARRSGPRRSTRCAGILPAASLSNVGIYGTGQGYEELLLRMRAHPLPEARAYADLMLHRAAQGDPVVPQAGRPRPTAAWPGATTSPSTRDGDGATSPSGCFPADDAEPSAAPTVHARRLRPRRRGQARRRDALPVHPPARAPDRGRGCGPCRVDERLAVVRAYVGDRPTAATSRAGRSSASTTASTCSPTTAPSATSSATAC